MAGSWEVTYYQFLTQASAIHDGNIPTAEQIGLVVQYLGAYWDHHEYEYVQRK